MSWFDWGLVMIGGFVVFSLAGALVLWVLSWVSDKWDAMPHIEEDEHASGLTAPWIRRKK